MSEGAIAVSVVRLTGTDLDDSIKYNTQMEKAVLAQFPDEVEHVWSRIGTAEIATDPMGIELTDMFITLKPRDQWKKAHTQAELTELIEAASARSARPTAGVFAADRNADERNGHPASAADVAVKLYGDDLDVLAAKGKEIEAILNQIPGSADVASEQITGQPVLQIKLNQAATGPLRRAGQGRDRHHRIDRQQAAGRSDRRAIAISAGRALARRTCEPALNGIGSILSADRLRRAIAAVAAGRHSRGRRTVDDYPRMGPAAHHGFGQRARPRHRQLRRRGRAEHERDNSQLPPGRYFYEFGGQFEHLQRARTRLLIVVPVALLLIFGLLYLTYQNWIDVLRVFIGSAVWLGRRHFRPVAARHAVFDFRRDRLHRPVRRGRAG